MTPTRRNLLGAALGGVAAAAVGPPALAAPAASWQLKWSPSARTNGLGAFETLEDDRADSHPAASPHHGACPDHGPARTGGLPALETSTGPAPPRTTAAPTPRGTGAAGTDGD